MTERRTGATSAQIEAAAVAEWGKSSLTDPTAIKVVTKYARMLVDEHHRIVRESDLRALLKKAMEAPRQTRQSDELYDRIAALLGPADE